MVKQVSAVSTAAIEIRRAVESDCDRLVVILRATYLATMAAIVPAAALAAFYQGGGPEEFVERCWPDFEVLTTADTVVALLFTQGQRVESLHVHPDSAGRGYGTRLLAFAELTIAAVSRRAELDVLVGNSRARTFYRARGWFDVSHFSGLELGGTPVAMVLMAKELGAVAGQVSSLE